MGRLAQGLDDRRRDGLGGDPRAFRKRVERYNRELIDSGDVARPRLGDLADWHAAAGEADGLGWPKGLRRSLDRATVITVVGWKLAEAESILPSLTPCDISGASIPPAGTPPAATDVASDPPPMSHRTPPEMSHPQNVRTQKHFGTEETTTTPPRVRAHREGRPDPSSSSSREVSPGEGKPDAMPGPDHRTRLYEWVIRQGLEPDHEADVFYVIRELQNTLKGVQAVPGTTFDDCEQILLAMEAAIEVNGLLKPFQVYARGTILNRIKSLGFTPLAAPPPAKGLPDPEAEARAEAERKRALASARERDRPRPPPSRPSGIGCRPKIASRSRPASSPPTPGPGDGPVCSCRSAGPRWSRRGAGLT